MHGLDALENRIGISFGDRDLLEQAMVHRSYLNENPMSPLSSNERLEFLGDAVLGFVVADELYRRFPDLPEGRLTRLRAALVCQDGLFYLAQEFGLGEFLLLGRGEDASGGRSKPTNLARALEALIGAIYLARSLEDAQRFTLRLLRPLLNEQYSCPPADYKSQLQELLHSHSRATPVYRIVQATGPDHEKVFTAEVLEGQKALAQGTGRSKKAAEAAAARAALDMLAKE